MAQHNKKVATAKVEEPVVEATELDELEEDLEEEVSAEDLPVAGITTTSTLGMNPFELLKKDTRHMDSKYVAKAADSSAPKMDYEHGNTPEENFTLIATNTDLEAFIGDRYFVFKAGEKVNVPKSVKEHLHMSGALAVL